MSEGDLTLNRDELVTLQILIKHCGMRCIERRINFRSQDSTPLGIVPRWALAGAAIWEVSEKHEIELLEKIFPEGQVPG